MIYKTFFGMHIDLSKIVAISDVYFIDRMGHGGWYVGFHINCQLIDKPIRYERELAHDEYEYKGGHILKLVDGTTTKELYQVENDQILAVANLQRQLDELVNAWKLWDK